MCEQKDYLVRVFTIVVGGVIAFGMFCFAMAFSMMVTRPAYGAEVNKVEYELRPGLPQVEVKITEGVCKKVGSFARDIKVMIDDHSGNQTIETQLVEDAMKNMHDTEKWIAYHMVAANGSIDAMREWAKRDIYKDTRNKNPDLTEMDIYEAFGRVECKEHLGAPIMVVQLRRKS